MTKEDIGIAAAAVVGAAAAIAGLSFDKTLGAIATAVAAIVVAVFGYLKARQALKSAEKSAREVATISADASIANTSKTVLVQTVTAERAKWRSEMREHVAELVMLLRASDRGVTVDWQRVDRLRSGVRLRLNPNGRGAATTLPDEHPLDRKLHAILDRLQVAGPAGVQEHDGVASDLEEGMAAILKAEWEVSKDEAEQGKLKRVVALDVVAAASLPELCCCSEREDA